MENTGQAEIKEIFAIDECGSSDTSLQIVADYKEYVKIVDNLQSKHLLGLVVRKPAFCICENKDADQLRGNREADQRLCFRYTDSKLPLLPKYEISSF